MQHSIRTVHADFNPHDGGLLDASCKGRNGYYHYFFCLGRQTHRNGCQAPYVSADLVEKQVESIWFRTEIPKWLQRRIKADLAKRIPERVGEVEHEYAAAQRRLADLENERRRLRDAYLAGAMPMDLLKEAQDRLAEEARILLAKAPPEAHSELVERMLDRALHAPNGCAMPTFAPSASHRSAACCPRCACSGPSTLSPAAGTRRWASCSSCSLPRRAATPAVRSQLIMPFPRAQRSQHRRRKVPGDGPPPPGALPAPSPSTVKRLTSRILTIPRNPATMVADS